jgi:outer membrane receptor for monomeric catechols
MAHRRSLGSALALGAMVFAVPAMAQQPQQTAVPTDFYRAMRDPMPPQPCSDCRGGEVGRPAASDTLIQTDDGKTIVPRTVIREQADFRLNDALRNVPGINRL